MFEIYTKDDCKYCNLLKNALKQLNINYTSYTLGTDFTREEFISKFNEPHTFPRVLKDGILIGGYTETCKYLKENLNELDGRS